jgi:hypothetical protein
MTRAESLKPKTTSTATTTTNKTTTTTTTSTAPKTTGFDAAANTYNGVPVGPVAPKTSTTTTSTAKTATPAQTKAASDVQRADFDHNGTVNADDYLVLRNRGDAGTAAWDADYKLWRDNMGKTVPSANINAPTSVAQTPAAGASFNGNLTTNGNINNSGSLFSVDLDSQVLAMAAPTLLIL